VKIHTSAGVPTNEGEGERLDNGRDSGGDRGWVRVPRNLHPHVNTHCLMGEI
jgi:hypothetical protein